MNFELKSSAFQNGRPIPAKHTCDGANVSPPLDWSPPPEGTKCLVLISDDPDAPGRVWVHWVVYNIPSSVNSLEENFPRNARLPDGTLQGMSDFGHVGYGGPCPPRGVHRYDFKLYAVDTVLALPPEATKAQVETQMNGHILAQAVLMGTYQRRIR